jgi:hypothetical protein
MTVQYIRDHTAADNSWDRPPQMIIKAELL